jgi:hypothetical protein
MPSQFPISSPYSFERNKEGLVDLLCTLCTMSSLNQLCLTNLFLEFFFYIKEMHQVVHSLIVNHRFIVTKHEEINKKID